jgi:PAS domain S-box-containing protein
LTVLIANLLAAASHALQSFLWWGVVSPQVLLIGMVDATLAAAVITPVLIALARQADREEAARKQAERFRDIVERSPVGIYRVSPEGKILCANQSLRTLLGEPGLNRLLARTIAPGETGPLEPRTEFSERLEREGRLVGRESSWRRADGTILCIRENARAVRSGTGALMYFEGTMEDVTERRRAEEDLHVALEGQEVLLKEIHHRVKNNIQVVSSLLSLHMQHVANPQDRAVFRESQDRLHSMALVHERLHQSEDARSVPFAEYLRELTHRLVRSYRTTDVSLQLNVPPVDIGVRAATPLGLIVNELVSNALKHAFQGTGGGHIRISLRPTGDKTYELIVADNGIGFPPSIDPRTSTTLGIHLVSTLVDQLAGTIELHRDAGTEFRITFHDRE